MGNLHPKNNQLGLTSDLQDMYKKDPKSVHKYIETWLGRTPTNRVVSVLIKMREQQSMEWYAVLPALQVLCEKKDPFRGTTAVCKMLSRGDLPKQNTKDANLSLKEIANRSTKKT